MVNPIHVKAPNCACILSFPRAVLQTAKHNHIITFVPCQHALYFVKIYKNSIIPWKISPDSVKSLYDDISGEELTIHEDSFRFVYKIVATV